MLKSAFLLVTFFAFVLCYSGHAQNNNGTIRGTVTDSNGAVLTNASVVLVNVGTAEQSTQLTNKEGYYTFTDLAPADYTVKVSAPAFAPWEGKLTLRVSQEAVINAKLKPGSVTATVTVTDVTPVINVANGTLSDVKEATRISTLPQINSDFINILNYSPGVVAGGYGGQGGGTTTRGSTEQYAYTRVNGIPGGSVTFMVDGQDANDRFTNEHQVTMQPSQTIQELKVTTSNGGAEYSTPGVVDVVTKSGTNAFHGQVSETYLDAGLGSAWGFYQYSPGQTRPHKVENQFGGQIGGPVRIPKVYNGKDKTFFYFDVLKQVLHEQAEDDQLVPMKAWTTPNSNGFYDYSAYLNVFSSAGAPVTIYDPYTSVYNPSTGYVTRQPFPGNLIPANRVNPVAAKILAALPTTSSPGSLCPGGTCSVSQWTNGVNWVNPASSQTDDDLRFTGKGDHYFGKNLLSGRYSYVNEPQLRPDYGGNLLNPRTNVYSGHNGTLSFTSPIGARAVNEAHLGIQFFNMYGGPLPQPGILSYLGLPAYPENPAVAWPGIDVYDNNLGLSYIDRANPKSQPNQNVSLSDSYSYIRGKHEMKFGFSVTNYRLNTLETQNPGGNYQFLGNFTAQQAQCNDGTQPAGSPAACDGSGAAPGILGGSGVVTQEFTGAALADLLLGETDLSYLSITPIFHTRQTDYAGYAEDNFKLSHRLTANLGIRYEYWSPYTDAAGLGATLNFNTNTAGTCSIPTYISGTATPQACLSAGSFPGAPWFAQSQPSVVIPNSGAGQDPNILAAYAGAGLPIQRASTAGLSNSLWSMNKTNWSPRLGFAYQFDPKTVVRGGYGIYYWTIPLVQYQQNQRDDAPWTTSLQNQTDYGSNQTPAELAFPVGPSPLMSQSGSNTVPPGYGTVAFPDPRQLGQRFLNTGTVTPSSVENSNGFAIAPFDPNYHAQEAQEWNLTIERDLGHNWAANIGYVGNHASHLVNFDPINTPLPTELSGTTDTNTLDLTPYPLYNHPSGSGSMDEFRWQGYSNHNELRAEVKHNFKDFLVQSYFTWAKSLTTSEGTWNSFGALEVNPATLTNNAPYATRVAAQYAPDSYLAAKTFVINGHYELPLGKGKQFLGTANTTTNELVSGWNVTIFYMWHSGLPFSPGYSTQGATYVLAPGNTNRGILPRGQRTAAKWYDDSLWDPSSGFAYAGQTFMKRDNPLDAQLLGNIPRNYMTGPGFSNADGTLYKITPIGQHMKLNLEVQVFNVLNHTNLGLPGAASSTNPTNGAINTEVGTARYLQFQGRLTF
jgi:hypothetical protein